MPVTLRVSSHQSRTLGADAMRVFHRGGTIGRSPDNDWVLPDPERFVSSQHAVISFEDGAYVLTDRSTNGTIVNGRELPQGGRVHLANGDRVTIGNYEISVTLEADGTRASTAGAYAPPHAQGFAPPRNASGAGDPLGASESVDPLDFFSDSGPSIPSHTRPAGAEPDHIPAEAEFFPPPRVRPEPQARAEPRSAAPATAAPASSGSIIPEDWDATGFSVPAEAPSPPPARDADLFGATLPPAGALPPADDCPRGGGVRAEASIDVGFPSGEPRVSATGAGRPAVDSGGVEALLRAAGLDPAAVDAAVMAALGEILRVVVGGLMDVLRARAELKNQFRVAMTTLKPVENNPLKFSANAEDALFNLFARRGQSFKAPVDAFSEAFDDLKAHQIAMMAGMRAAFGSLLRRFDPDELQTAFDRGLKRAAILDVINKTKYWELYREMYAELGDDDATFRRLFGDEFAQAYEEQMQRLTALHKR